MKENNNIIKSKFKEIINKFETWTKSQYINKTNIQKDIYYLNKYIYDVNSDVNFLCKLDGDI